VQDEFKREQEEVEQARMESNPNDYSNEYDHSLGADEIPSEPVPKKKKGKKKKQKSAAA
jgi:hypothetical protein